MTTPFRGIVQESYDGYGNIRVDTGPDGQPVHMPPSEVFAPNWTLFDVIENEAGIFECWIRFAADQGQFEWQVYDFAAKRSIAGIANDFAFPARMQCRQNAREIAERKLKCRR